MKHQFTIDDQVFRLDGRPFVIRCGEIHFTRVAPEYWSHRLKMCKAMGLNTVCVYLFWNFHEWEEGRFNWSGWADVAEFCRLAQQEGLWVMLRPGPYSCAEWEMGGLPWWLLKQNDIGLRTSDPAFVGPAARYLREVGRILAPLQVTQGGPILMVQVENEYGSFGDDVEYMRSMRQALLDGGFDVPLFACNPPSDLKKGYCPELFQVVNFGPGAAKSAFDELRQLQPTGPLMNGEYYPAWFDTWGRSHHTGQFDRYLEDLELMLKNDISFSIYMAHGGTSFGLWAGADRPFLPDTSSYDYDAPISEAGWTTPKFERTRELFSKYLLEGEVIPPAPAANRVIEIEPFALDRNTSLFDSLPEPLVDHVPQTMEFYDQSRGCIIYRTTIPAGGAGTLEADAIHDFGWVFLDGKPVGTMDRRRQRFHVEVPARQAPSRVDIVIEAMGRVNFGAEVFDRKGLHSPVKLVSDGKAQELLGWEIFSLPLDSAHFKSLEFSHQLSTGPAFWHGVFELEEVGDTFLDVRNWGKGVVWINGHCLGRFWNIGPTQTMYCPAIWLRRGHNEVVALDFLGPLQPEIAGLVRPIQDELRLELDFSPPVRAAGTFNVVGMEPVYKGSFQSSSLWQEALFERPAQGRYLCLESLNSHGGDRFAAAASLDALDSGGQSLPKSNWKVLWADSEECKAEDGNANNVLDGQAASIWHTEYSGQQPDHPHRLVIDMGSDCTVGGIRYLSRSGNENVSGRIKDYRIYVASHPFDLDHE